MNSKGGPLWKKCFIEGPETHPDILRGGCHRNPYQLENAIESGGTVFGLNSLPGSCVHSDLSWDNFSKKLTKLKVGTQQNSQTPHQNSS